jgi:hypothetical protein
MPAAGRARIAHTFGYEPVFFGPRAAPSRRECFRVPDVESKCAVIRSRPSVSGSPSGDRPAADAQRSLTVHLGSFAWETIEQESERLGVSVDELVAFSVLYYLADVDSGRIARRISKSPYPDTEEASS